jgi:hypothetical protein
MIRFRFFPEETEEDFLLLPVGVRVVALRNARWSEGVLSAPAGIGFLVPENNII